MKVFLTSYATKRFHEVQRDLSVSAIRRGIGNILSYTKQDLLSTGYYQQNKEILDEICGAGYWAWKPFFIIEALKHLRNGDVLFYCDAGSLLLESPEPLVRLCVESASGVMA